MELFGFEDKEIAQAAHGLDNQIDAGIWNSAHSWKRFRSRQIHALLQYVIKENRKLSARIDTLEGRDVS